MFIPREECDTPGYGFLIFLGVFVLIVLATVFLPSLCSAGGFGYSYEEEGRITGDCDFGDTCDLKSHTVGIFKVYLDVELPPLVIDKSGMTFRDSLPDRPVPDPFEYRGLRFVFKQGRGKVWVENVQEVPLDWENLNDKAWDSFLGHPCPEQIWDIRCLAIEEIERLKEKKVSFFKYTNPDEQILIMARGDTLLLPGAQTLTGGEMLEMENCRFLDESKTWALKDCPYCGEKLK